MTQFAITGRVTGVDRSGGQLQVEFTCMGVDRGDVSLSADEPNENQVDVRLQIGPGGQWHTIERVEVNVGAAETRGRMATFSEVGRTPVLTSIGGTGSTEVTFRVLPGYIDPASSPRQLEFTFVAIGDLISA